MVSKNASSRSYDKVDRVPLMASNVVMASQEEATRFDAEGQSRMTDSSASKNETNISIGEDESIRFYQEKLQEDNWHQSVRSKVLSASEAERQQFTQVKRDKSIQKLQKLNNRLRKFNDLEKDSILADLEKLDISRFISEITDILAEGNYRLKDVPALVEICVYLHLRYEEFSSVLYRSLYKALCGDVKMAQFTSSSTPHAKENNSFDFLTESNSNYFNSPVAQQANALLHNTDTLDNGLLMSNKGRQILRLYGELFIGGVLTDEKPFIICLHKLCDSTAPIPQILHHFAILEMFCKRFGGELLGITSQSLQESAKALGSEYKATTYTSPAVQSTLTQIILSFYLSDAFKILQKLHLELIECELENQQLLLHKGCIDSENSNRYGQIKEKFDKVFVQVNAVGDALNQAKFSITKLQEGTAETLQLNLQHNAFATRIGGNASFSKEDSGQADGKSQELLMWEDSSERIFYTELLNLKELLPSFIIGPATRLEHEAYSYQEGDAAKASKGTVQQGDSAANHSSLQETIVTPSTSVKEEFDSTVTKNTGNVSPYGSIEVYIQKLMNVSEGSEIDQLALDFFLERLNNKSNRLRIVKEILHLHRSSLHLIPFFAKLVATFAPYLKDVRQTVVEELQAEFKNHLSTKNPTDIESKIRCVRFLSELTKFGIIPAGFIIDCFNTLLEDFTQHHVELACHIAQCCGRYLLGMPLTSIRFENLLSKMLHIRNVRNLPPHLEVLVLESYYQLKPSSKHFKTAKESPPLKQFIQKLIFDPSFVENEEDVCKLLRKLPWNDSKCVKWLKSSFLDLNMNAQFEGMDRRAALLCSLAKPRPDFVMDCIDALMESMQLSMEKNDFREGPFRVRQVKFFSELYKYRLIDATVVFDLLYHLIGFGSSSSFQAGNIKAAHTLVNENKKLAGSKSDTSKALDATESTSIEEFNSDRQTKTEQLTTTTTELSGSILEALAEPYILTNYAAPVDPPGDYFRIILVCVILDTCGNFFTRGAPRVKLDRFLSFFQRYFLTKEPLPMSITYSIKDTVEALRPQLLWFQDLKEANQHISELLEDEAKILNDLFGDSYGAGDIEDELFQDSSEEEMDEDDDSLAEGDNQETNEDNLYDRRTFDEAVDDSFDKELNQIIADSINAARSLRRSVDALTVPSVKLLRNDIADFDTTPPQGEVGGAADFRLLLRKSDRRKKFQIKHLQVPSDNKLTRSKIISTAEEIKEKAEIKRLVMDSVERSQKEERDAARKKAIMEIQKSYSKRYRKRKNAYVPKASDNEGFEHP